MQIGTLLSHKVNSFSGSLMGDADEIKKTNFTNFTKDYKFYLGETKICENEEI